MSSMTVAIAYLMKRAQDALNRALVDAFAELGLTLPQYAVLYNLAETPGLSSAELARRSFVTPQTMNEVIQLLERDGLVARPQHRVHGRIGQPDRTAGGGAKLAAANRRTDAIEKKMVASLTPVQREQLSSWLRQCVTNLQRWELSSDPGVTVRRRAQGERDGRLDVRLSRVESERTPSRRPG